MFDVFCFWMFTVALCSETLHACARGGVGSNGQKSLPTAIKAQIVLSQISANHNCMTCKLGSPAGMWNESSCGGNGATVR